MSATIRDHWRIRLSVRARLTLWFVMVAIGAVVVGIGVVYYIGLGSIQGTLGQTYCQIADRVARQFEDRIVDTSRFVGGIATDVLTTEVAVEQSERRSNWSGDQIARRRDDLELSRDDGDATGRRAALLHAELSQRLAVLANLRGKSTRRLAVFDRYSDLVAESSRPTGPELARDRVLRSLIGETSHFTFVDYDKETEEIRFVTPVWAGVDIVGYVLGDFSFPVLAEVVEKLRFGDTGEAKLVDYAGIPLLGAASTTLIQALAVKPPERQISISGRSTPYWVTIDAESEWLLWRRLVCVAPVDRINGLRERFELSPWAIVVTQTPSESYTSLRRSLGYFAVVGLLGAAVAGTGGAIMAWRIASPIMRLREGVHRFGQGDRDSPVEVTSTDEIGQLAAEINRMARRVRASENELRAFAQAVADAGDAIFITDADGTIYYANAAFEAITGHPAYDVTGRGPFFFGSESAAGEESERLRRSIELGEPYRGEIWNTRKDGTVYPADVTVSPIRDDTGTCVAFIGIHRDVSLAHEYQERLQREVEARTREIRETESLTVMGRMASMIAHDLRNSLSTIKMNFQILLRRHNEEKDVENEPCRIGLDQVLYMEEILRDMLSYARPGELHADWYDMPKLVDEALAGFAAAMASARIELVHERESRLPKVYCDRTKIMQILRNLIQNAVGAMPNGGTLVIDAHVALDGPEPTVFVTINDDGEGIPADVRKEIFDPFFTTRARGTGLGLAIVKRLVDLHGGTIEVRSKEGIGTSVTIGLPTGQSNNRTKR